MMDEQLSTVATLANYQALLRAERLINQQLSNLDKAEQCGIACSDFRSGVQQVMDRIASLKTHFFTPPPTQ